MTWSPLACGIISGKYGNGVPESSRASLKVFSCSSRKVWGWERGLWRGRDDGLKELSRVVCGFPRRQSARRGLGQTVSSGRLPGALSPEPARGLCPWPCISQPFVICQHKTSSSSCGAWGEMPSDLVRHVGAQTTLLRILMLEKAFHSSFETDEI